MSIELPSTERVNNSGAAPARLEAPAGPSPASTNVAVVIPMVAIYDWAMFDALSEDVPIIVCDDSDGRLSPPPRRNVRYFDYDAQRRIMGRHYPAIPHKSSACRNFGHYLAYREGYDVIIALDYDCRVRPGWLDDHLLALSQVTDAHALAGRWINTVEQHGFYARGYPYEFRDPLENPVVETHASGEVKLNIGVWENILDLNGIDKLQREPPADPGLRGRANFIALGNIPVCGMNTAFRAELAPAYFFMPDVWINGWRISRHDDIWGGYVLKKLMDRRGDLVSYGRPVVEHTRQSPMNSVVVVEHYTHLLGSLFFELIDEAAESVTSMEYAAMFAELTMGYCAALRRNMPRQYRQALQEIGLAMQQWAAVFV